MHARNIPSSVRLAFWFWMAAIVTAIIELAIRLLADPRGLAETIAASGTELMVRGCAYVLLLMLACLVLWGSNLARHLLTAIYGAIGTFSLVVEPISWMIDGGNVVGFLAEADAAQWLITISRTAHIAAVLGGVWFGYRSDASNFFRRRRCASSTTE